MPFKGKSLAHRLAAELATVKPECAVKGCTEPASPNRAVCSGCTVRLRATATRGNRGGQRGRGPKQTGGGK